MTFGLRSRGRSKGATPWYEDEDDELSELDDFDAFDQGGATTAPPGPAAGPVPVPSPVPLPGMDAETPWHLDPSLRSLLGMPGEAFPARPSPDALERPDALEQRVVRAPAVTRVAPVETPVRAAPPVEEAVVDDDAVPAPEEQSVVLVAGRPVVVPIPAALAADAGFELVTDPAVLAAAGLAPSPSGPAAPVPAAPVPAAAAPPVSPAPTVVPAPAAPVAALSADAGVWGDVWADEPPVVSAPPPVSAWTPEPEPERTAVVRAAAPTPAVPVPPVSKETFVAARGLSKRFGHGDRTLVALEGVDLEIAEGELVAITGPSGSGKTTLLHCLSGLEPPDEGTVLVHGEDLRDLSEGDRARLRAAVMGFVFQDPNLLPLLTVAENVELPLLLNGWSARDARSEAVRRLDEVGLAAAADRRPVELSGGERQRAAVARALVGEPHVIWADEPTAELDRESAEPVLDVIGSLHADGRTVVVVTHDEALAALAPRRIRMRGGRIVADERVDR